MSSEIDAEVIPIAEAEAAMATTLEGEALPGRRRQPKVLVIAATVWLSVVIFAAIFADLLPLRDPNIDVGHGIQTPPFHIWAEPLGTDGLARSELSRLVYGARASLETALASVVIAMVIGLLLGVLAAYLGGWFDTAVGLITDSVLAFPGLVLLLALAAFLTPSMETLIIGLAIIAVPNFARLARASALRYQSAEFIEAARVLGARTSTILFREIIPNVMGVLAAYAGVVTAGLVIAEASLSYLGLGIPPPTPSWGNLINDGRTVLADKPYYVLAPSLALFFTVFSLSTIGEWLRARSVESTRV